MATRHFKSLPHLEELYGFIIALDKEAIDKNDPEIWSDYVTPLLKESIHVARSKRLEQLWTIAEETENYEVCAIIKQELETRAGILPQ